MYMIFTKKSKNLHTRINSIGQNDLYKKVFERKWPKWICNIFFSSGNKIWKRENKLYIFLLCAWKQYKIHVHVFLPFSYFHCFNTTITQIKNPQIKTIYQRNVCASAFFFFLIILTLCNMFILCNHSLVLHVQKCFLFFYILDTFHMLLL